MSLWNYIGEFFLFRWLFDKLRMPTTEHDSHTEVSGASINGNSEYLNGNLDEGIAPDDAITDVGNNLIDDSDNSEELDDLDIFMRNNRSCLHHGDYDGDYHIAVVMTFRMIGIPVAILNHTMISMTNRTTMI